jgi:acyl carrier protein
MNDADDRQAQSAAAQGGTDSPIVSDFHEHSVVPNAYVGPRTVLQEVLLTVWVGILGIGKVGIEDDFFELGGDSILATQMISRLRQMFRMDLPATVLFDAPTIEKLAQYMIASEVRPGLTEKTAGLLKQIEGMSEEEVACTLRSKEKSKP